MVVHDTLNSGIKFLEVTNSVIENSFVSRGALAESPECLADPVCEAADSKLPATVNMMQSYNTGIEN